MNPFEFVKAISYSKEDFSDDPEAIKHYDPFLANRSFSYHKDTAILANEMNCCPWIPKDQQFSWMLNMVRKRKRFAKWEKPETSDDIRVISDYYGVSTSKAQKMLSLLNREQINDLKKRVSKNGREKS